MKTIHYITKAELIAELEDLPDDTKVLGYKVALKGEFSSTIKTSAFNGGKLAHPPRNPKAYELKHLHPEQGLLMPEVDEYPDKNGRLAL